MPFNQGKLHHSVKIHFILLPDRIASDKSEGTGLAAQFGLVCLPDTELKSKNRFLQVKYSSHVTDFNELLFIQWGAKKSVRQYAVVDLDRPADITTNNVIFGDFE